MSLMGSVVTLYVLCWVLAASSSKKTVSRILNDIPPTSAECINGSICANSTTNIQSLPNITDLNQQLHPNNSKNLIQNQTVNGGKPSLINKFNDSLSQPNISLTQNPSIQYTVPPAKVDNSTTGPQVTTAPLSHTNKNELEDTTVGARSSATTTHSIIHASTTGETLITATSASTLAATSSTSSPNTTTTTSPTTTAHMAFMNASTSAPKIVHSTTVSTNPKTTGLKPLEPETTPATTTRAITTSTTTTSRASVPTNSSSTTQYLSPVVKTAGQQLIDKASLLALLLFGLLFFFVVVAVFMTQAYESYRRKDYTQVDYLINGMYTDSCV